MAERLSPQERKDVENNTEQLSPDESREKQTSPPETGEKHRTPEQAEEERVDAERSVEAALEEQEEAQKRESEAAATQEQETEPQAVITPAKKEQVFQKTMHNVQQEMSPAARQFSKIIHNPVVEKTSDIAGKTIARPSSILFGGFIAFAVMLGVYLLAKNNGFRLSGAEFIVLFIIGWFVGILVDFLRTMITGKSSV